jgi:hypothetical protein
MDTGVLYPFDLIGFNTESTGDEENNGYEMNDTKKLLDF